MDSFLALVARNYPLEVGIPVLDIFIYSFAFRSILTDVRESFSHFPSKDIPYKEAFDSFKEAFDSFKEAFDSFKETFDSFIGMTNSFNSSGGTPSFTKDFNSFVREAFNSCINDTFRRTCAPFINSFSSFINSLEGISWASFIGSFTPSKDVVRRGNRIRGFLDMNSDALGCPGGIFRALHRGNSGVLGGCAKKS
jgi:hypothetical protein